MSWFVSGYLLLCSLSGMQTANIEYMTNCIRDHFSENRNHDINPTYKMAAKQFIFHEFKRFGIEAVYHDFTVSGFTGSFTNVVGILKGSNFGRADDKIIGIGAHYDTVQNTKGVDDNGAGVAAMLEVARQLNKNDIVRKHTIIFVSFDLEEYGLIGSKVFISSWLSPWVSMNYGMPVASLTFQGMIILDTMMEYNKSSHSQLIPPQVKDAFPIFFPEVAHSLKSDSYRGDFLALIYRKQTADDSLVTSLKSSWAGDNRKQFELESFALPYNLIPEKLLRNFFRSDHTNFWNMSIPAVFLTDSAEFRGDMKQCYHKQCDDIDTMLTDDNIKFLSKTADAIANSMHELTKSTDTSVASRNACILTPIIVVLSSFTILLGF